MGITVQVDSLEDMCDMMCDNNLPKEKDEYYIFTFGVGQKHGGYYVKIKGTYGGARQKMFDKYGKEWAFQYSEEQWQDWLNRKPEYVEAEELLEVID